MRSGRKHALPEPKYLVDHCKVLRDGGEYQNESVSLLSRWITATELWTPQYNMKTYRGTNVRIGFFLKAAQRKGRSTGGGMVVVGSEEVSLQEKNDIVGSYETRYSRTTTGDSEKVKTLQTWC